MVRVCFDNETMDDILAAVDAIETDYAGNTRAGCASAAELSGGEKIIGHMMPRAGL